MDIVTVDYEAQHQNFWIRVRNDVLEKGYYFTVPLEPFSELLYNRNPAILQKIVSKVHAMSTKRAFDLGGYAGEEAFFGTISDHLVAQDKIVDLKSQLRIAEEHNKETYKWASRLQEENAELKSRIKELESTSHWVDKVLAMGGDVPLKEGTTEHEMMVKAFTALEEAKQLEEAARKDKELV